MAYITVAEAKAWLGIDVSDTTKDALLTGLIDAVSESIDSWTDTTFTGPQVVTNELHDARRQDVLIPLNWPVISIQALKVSVDGDGAGGSALATTDFNHDEVEIRLLWLSLPQQRGYVRLDYTWGFATTPERVKLACKLGVEGYYRMRARQSVGITSKSKEGESISYKDGWNTEAGLPVEAVSLLQEYRRIEFDMGAGTAMATRNN